MKFLRVFFALPLLFVTCLSGCASNTVDGITTITVNVATIDAYGKAFGNAAAMIADLPGLAGTPNGDAILAVETVVGVDLAAFDKAANGSLTLTFNATSVPAALTSVLSDGSTLLNDSKTALGSISASASTTANLYINALETVVSLFQAAVGSAPVSATMGAAPRMSEAQALAVLSKK